MGVYAVELLLAERPEIPKARLLEALRARLPRVEPLDPSSDLLGFLFPSHSVTYAGGQRVPAQLLVAIADERRDRDRASKLAPAVEQSWRFPKAREAVAAARSSVLVTDVMADGLERSARLSLLQGALDAVLDVVTPLALHWQPSQQIISVEDFRARARPADGRPDLEAGPINVRYWRVEGSTTGDCLMDTMGLATFGLPDLQCHFRGLPPRDVAGVLFSTAAYVFEEGDVIQDGHTVPGVPKDRRWRCRHEDALSKPGRVVLDLDPGPPHAAAR